MSEAILRYRVPDIGLACAAVRTWRGLSQYQLAARMQTPRTYISKLERRDLEPGLDVMLRVAAALEVTPYFLLSVAGFDRDGIPLGAQ